MLFGKLWSGNATSAITINISISRCARDVITRFRRHPADVTVAFVGRVAAVVDVVAAFAVDDAPAVVAEELAVRVAASGNCRAAAAERDREK